MKILYVHGFGSHYDPKHEKIQLLESLGTVVGVDLEFGKGFDSVYNTVLDKVIDEQVDLIVGTSMGGYIAAHVGAQAGVPFVALNPITNPRETLKRWLGNFTDSAGRDHYLSESAVESYPEISKEGYGLVIVESSDEIVHSADTVSLLSEHYTVERITGGSHCFTHMEKVLPLIKEFFTRAEASYGVDNDD